MTSPSTPPDRMPNDSASCQMMSALVDGETTPADTDGAVDINRALLAWHDDADAREAWHSYQLIGDILRSEDLARAPTADLAFLNHLRGRLDAEPVHLAQASDAHAATPKQAVPDSIRAPAPARWQAGFALAASVAVAAVALLLVRSAGSGVSPEAVPVLARQELPVARGGAGAGGTTPMLAVNSAGVLRDPRLDEFLRMHQMARGGLAVGVPGGSLQRADLQMPGGNER